MGIGGTESISRCRRENPKKCQIWEVWPGCLWACKKMKYLGDVEWMTSSKHQGILDLIFCKPSAADLSPSAAFENPATGDYIIFGEGWKHPTYTANAIALKTVQWNLSGGLLLSALVVGFQFWLPAMFSVDVTVSVGSCKRLGRRNAYSCIFPIYIQCINISAVSASSSNLPCVLFVKGGSPEGFVPWRTKLTL